MHGNLILEWHKGHNNHDLGHCVVVVTYAKDSVYLF